MALAGRSLTGIDDLSNDDIADILAEASRLSELPRREAKAVLPTKLVCTAFFEPSTRTRLSFEAAAHRLGASVMGFSDAKATSSSKGETLEDTARVLAGYADALVVRHFEVGAVKRMANATDIPVVNAGDGSGEHPTQTLVDLFTIQKELGQLADAKVAVVGDLRYGRTVHSLLPALNRLGASALSVPAPGLALPGDLQPLAPQATLEAALADANVVYVTRVQKERFASQAAYDAACGALHINRATLDDAKFDGIVLHPLPRVDELATDVDPLPVAKYFEQAQNGVPVRMALLALLLEDAL